ncbi:MAG: serine hydrolase domain-containing protein [Thermoguttaceae bacterium]
MIRFSVAILILLIVIIVPPPAEAQNKKNNSSATEQPSKRPITGKSLPAWKPLDAAMEEMLDLIGCQAGALAVELKGNILFSRGYGWADKNKTVPTQPESIMRIASCTKPFTAAIVKELFRNGRLKPDTPVVAYLEIHPRQGEIIDSRWKQITVEQLLDHKGGFDRNKLFDPMFRTKQIESELHLNRPARPGDVIEYMLGKPLQFTPGERSEYSNFGYCILGRVIEKATGAPYIKSIERICRPLGINDMILSRDNFDKRDPKEVWYPVPDGNFSIEVMDSHGGLAASAPSLCKFLAAYWINGNLRKPKEKQVWLFFGSLPGTTAMIQQREDGMNVAVLFNGRRNEHFEEDNTKLRKTIDNALDEIKAAIK